MSELNNALLQEILDQVRPLIHQGKVADYIPALADVAADNLAIAVCLRDGTLFQAGDAETRFSIQSISKALSLTVALTRYEDSEIWQRVGKEPSGQPFNSLVQLELEQGKPRNPFINAGALVVSDMVQSRFASPYIAMRDFVRRLSCNGDIVVNKVVAESEYEHRSRNAAMAYLMKAYGNFENEV